MICLLKWHLFWTGNWETASTECAECVYIDDDKIIIIIIFIIIIIINIIIIIIIFNFIIILIILIIIIKRENLGGNVQTVRFMV